MMADSREINTAKMPVFSSSKKGALVDPNLLHVELTTSRTLSAASGGDTPPLKTPNPQPGWMVRVVYRVEAAYREFKGKVISVTGSSAFQFLVVKCPKTAETRALNLQDIESLVRLHQNIRQTFDEDISNLFPADSAGILDIEPEFGDSLVRKAVELPAVARVWHDDIAYSLSVPETIMNSQNLDKFNNWLKSEVERVARRIILQIEYYFSWSNWSRDNHLRRLADSFDRVPLKQIARFNRLRSLSRNMKFIRIVLLRRSGVNFTFLENDYIKRSCALESSTAARHANFEEIIESSRSPGCSTLKDECQTPLVGAFTIKRFGSVVTEYPNRDLCTRKPPSDSAPIQAYKNNQYFNYLVPLHIGTKR